MINNCLLDTLDYDTSSSLDFDCFPFAWELNATYTTNTDAGKIATTWTTLPYQTFTFTSENGANYTETFDGSGNLMTGTPAITTTTAGAGKATSPAGTTAAKTSASKSTTSTSTTASPTSSKSASKAAPGMRLSYGRGVLVALSVLGLVL
jgi:hypothetical protein